MENRALMRGEFSTFPAGTLGTREYLENDLNFTTMTYRLRSGSGRRF